jgi:hypothetical protein
MTSPQDAVMPLRFAITPNVNEMAVEISAETITNGPTEVSQ